MKAKRVKLTIELELEGEDAGEAQAAIDRLLDDGTLQQSINSYAEDTGRDFTVTSCVVSNST